jgi:hypothetical protein
VARDDIDKETESITVDLITGTGGYHSYFKSLKAGNMLEISEKIEGLR